jgi:hypothetical protein
LRVVRGGGGIIAKPLAEKDQRKKLASDFREYLKKQGVDLQEYAKDRRLMREQKAQIRTLVNFASTIRCGTILDLDLGPRLDPTLKVCPKTAATPITTQPAGPVVGPVMGPWMPTPTCDPDLFYNCLMSSLNAKLKRVTINISVTQQFGEYTWLEGEAANVTVTLTNASQIEWKNVVAILSVSGCAHVDPFIGSIVFGDLSPFGGWPPHFDDWDNEAAWARLGRNETRHFHVCVVGGPLSENVWECNAKLCVSLSAEPVLYATSTKESQTYVIHHQ